MNYLRAVCLVRAMVIDGLLVMEEMCCGWGWMGDEIWWMEMRDERRAEDEGAEGGDYL
jgi:hypothetical protein